MIKIKCARPLGNEKVWKLAKETDYKKLERLEEIIPLEEESQCLCCGKHINTEQRRTNILYKEYFLREELIYFEKTINEDVQWENLKIFLGKIVNYFICDDCKKNRPLMAFINEKSQ